MNVQKRNNVTIYNLSSGPTLPEWLGDRARRNLSKRDEQIRRRIELIQDFQMPSSSSRVVQSSDGRYVMVGGTYQPRVRCYDVHELTMKFERYVDAQIVDICMLGEDYGKMGILMENRTIAFHAHYGAHESVRVPKFGRGMAYEPTTCELLVAASGSEVYRLNLEEGRFSEPWSMETSEASASCISVAQAQPLAAVGCTDGIVRFWDNRSPDTLLKPFLKLDVQAVSSGYGFADENNLYYSNPNEITSVAYDTSGLYMAAGTAGGLVALYDVRSSKPLHIKEHKHGMPIHTLKFHSGSGCILSSDEKLVKIWKYKNSGDLVNTGGAASTRFDLETDVIDDESRQSGIGAVVANVEGTGKLCDFIMAGDEKDPFGNNSGVLLCANDQPKLECYYIPKVGLAPKWCSFLENITEELEERDLKGRDGLEGSSDLVKDGQETVFENYKFVSRDDLEKLGVSDLIGTPMLRAYMHGFFMDINLYNRVRAVANPFEYEEYRKKKLKERLEAKRASRIAPKDQRSSQTAVNADLANRLQDKAENSTSKAGKVASRLLTDDRFGGLFSNPDYQIDEEDDDFKQRNPSGVSNRKKKRESMDSDDDDESDEGEQVGVTAGYQETELAIDPEEASNGGSDDNDDYQSASDSDEDDGFRGAKIRGEAYFQAKSVGNKGRSKAEIRKQTKKTTLHEVDDIEDTVVGAGTNIKKAPNQRVGKLNMPLEKRFQLQEAEDAYVKVTSKGGSKEITYIPKDSRKKRTEVSEMSEGDGSGDHEMKRQRRSARDLRSKGRKHFKN
eukprot:Nitzschia sp. Nitz4//scaffold55_size114948//8658//11015//NITZ4_003881-RA/size114948-processed-gene-0.58-mRNA-1//-1//CDS//3329554470//8051//frame0